MMNTTHAALAVSLASVTVVVYPEVATVAAVAAILGSVLPDLDLVVGVHRRTLHFPVLGWVLALPALLLALAVPDVGAVAAAGFLLGVALHSTMDVLDAGPELRPWETHTDQAVYAHVPGRWLRPRRWIRYDGAPEDFLLGLGLALPALVLYDGWIRTVVVVGLALSLGYTVYRKRIPEVSEALIG